MNITFKNAKLLDTATEQLIEEKLTAPLRLLGDDSEEALLEIEVDEAPAEGRSSEPYRLVARLAVGKKVYYAEAVKPTPSAAADRVRSDLEAEIRSDRGRSRRLWKRGGSAVKNILRFGRP